MEDAYTIGIRLALDDGVSAGIAAIAGDLAMLDRTIAATTGSLARLTALAGDATHAATAELQRFARQAEQFARAPLPPAAEVPTPAPPPRTIETQPGAAAPATTAPAAAAPRLDITLPPPPAPVVRLAAPPPPAAAPVVRILSPAPAPVFSPQPMPTPSAPLPPAAFAPLPPRDQPVSPAAAPDVEVQQHFVTNQSASTVFPAAAAAPAPMAPLPAAAPPIAPAASLDPRLPSVAPPPQAQASGGPNHGDVFLDGMRVGRWMSDSLARQASRPQAGSTAFDPRIGATWPGAQHGT